MPVYMLQMFDWDFSCAKINQECHISCFLEIWISLIVFKILSSIDVHIIVSVSLFT